MKVAKTVLVLVIILLVAGEVALRMRGPWVRPLYEADERFEYRLKPLQETRNGPARISTNEYGMRSGPLGTRKGKRVLFIGDSVISGMEWVDNDSLATTLLETLLSDRLGMPVQVLNASSPSWGPDNAAAFLKTYGLFDADIIVGVWNSDDFSDRMGFEAVVGHNPYFRDRQRLLAWGHAWDEFLIRTGRAGAFPEGPAGFNTGWYCLQDLATDAGIPFTVVLHPRLSERSTGTWNVQGAALRDSLTAWGVPHSDTWNGLKDRHYADDIHLSVAGQAVLAQFLVRHVEEALARKADSHPHLSKGQRSDTYQPMAKPWVVR